MLYVITLLPESSAYLLLCWQSSAKARTSSAIAKLMNLSPSEALLVEMSADGCILGEQLIETALVQRGDVMKVLPGQKVSVSHRCKSNE